MTVREFFRSRLDAEKPTFLRVLRALPADRMDYRPHEKSPSAAEIVRTMVAELQGCSSLIDRGRIDWSPPAPRARDAMIADWERAYGDLVSRAAELDEAGWGKPGTFVAGKITGEQPVGVFLWGLFFDAIHHRGQLTTYIRPMGGKVPSIYGPSGDAAPGQ
jgi:uncharacterized damage-inducible protein DinB